MIEFAIAFLIFISAPFLALQFPAFCYVFGKLFPTHKWFALFLSAGMTFIALFLELGSLEVIKFYLGKW